MTVLDPDLVSRAEAEFTSWVRELEAERVTHSGESWAQVVQRVQRERPESPDQRRRRLWREEQRFLRGLDRFAPRKGSK